MTTTTLAPSTRTSYTVTHIVPAVLVVNDQCAHCFEAPVENGYDVCADCHAYQGVEVLLEGAHVETPATRTHKLPTKAQFSALKKAGKVPYGLTRTQARDAGLI